MIKTKSELSDHIYTLIKSGKLSFETYSDWLYAGEYSEIYEKFAEKTYKDELEKTLDKDYYINHLNNRVLYLTQYLGIHSVHSRNEYQLMEVKVLSKFLKKLRK